MTTLLLIQSSTIDVIECDYMGASALNLDIQTTLLAAMQHQKNNNKNI